MEHFDGHQQQIKQKDVYLLHLDAPRIVLISLILIGVIVGSFLIGMNFIKSNGEITASSSSNDGLFPNGNSFESPIPAPPSGDDTEKTDAEGLFADKNEKAESADMLSDTTKNDPVEIVTSESLHAVIPPVATKMPDKSASSDRIAKNQSQKKTIAHSRKAIKKESQSKKTHTAKTNHKNSSRVIAVTGTDAYDERIKEFPGYSIQVASYDKEDRANREIERLKDMSFDAYMDRSQVNGKLYYRVRIGPMASKIKALSLLREIQGNERYENSYIVTQ